MLMRGAILLLLASGCLYPEPTNDPAPAPAGVDVMLSVARDVARDEFGLDLPRATKVTIRWFAGDCLTGLPTDHPVACPAGMYYPPWRDHGPTIYVLVRARLVDTLLPHELLHYYSWLATGDEDPQHEHINWSALESEIASTTHQILEGTP